MLSVRLIPHQGLPFRRVEVCNSSEVWANLSIVSIYPKCFICCCCLVAKSCLTLCDPLDLQLTRLLCPWDFPDKRILEWVAIFFSRGSSQPRDWTHLPALAGRFFTTEPPGKPKVSYQSVQSLSCVRLFATPWTAACQASLSITNCQSLPKLTSIELVMPSNHLVLCHPLLLLPSIFPSIRVFSNESALHIRWPSIRVSASTSVLPMNT